LASGRAITIGVGLPVILLIAAHGNPTPTRALGISPGTAPSASRSPPGTPYGVRLVAAREAGGTEALAATPLPRACYFLGPHPRPRSSSGSCRRGDRPRRRPLYGTHLTVSDAIGALVVFVLGALAWGIDCHGDHRPRSRLSRLPRRPMMLTYFPVIIISGHLRRHQRTALAVDPRQLSACRTARPMA